MRGSVGLGRQAPCSALCGGPARPRVVSCGDITGWNIYLKTGILTSGLATDCSAAGK